MKIIGITGGVGAGKSEVLNIISDMCNCIIVRADELAKSLEAKGEVCYEALIKLLSSDILDDNMEIVPQKMARSIFESDDTEILSKVNAIIHPQVKKRILSMIDSEFQKGEAEYFFIEAALLIEDNYDLICDELWYIYADEHIRAQRLATSRGYSQEKIAGIMASQLDDSTFREKCDRVIDNSRSIEDTYNQLKELL